MDYTTVVVASAPSPGPSQFIAPYSGCSMGETSATAAATPRHLRRPLQTPRRRTASLPAAPPAAGPRAYPGDVFYLHSRLLERAAKMSNDQGGGSLTALR